MKKTIALMSLGMAILYFNLCYANRCFLEEDNEREAIILTQNNNQNNPITRSVTPIAVSAILDNETGQIEVYFDEPEGLATIQITCMGQVISSYNCDTEEEWVINLPAPTSSGNYCITIRTSSAEYIGYFSF